MNTVFVQEETLTEMMQLASKLPWTDALAVWKLNGKLKKRKGYRKGGNVTKAKSNCEVTDAAVDDTEQPKLPQALSAAGSQTKAESTAAMETSTTDSEEAETAAKLLKFRVTCNRAGDRHSFSSNEAARDFGGAVQEFFQWKADMTKFDVEVGLLVQTGLTQIEWHHTSLLPDGSARLKVMFSFQGVTKDKNNNSAE